jgi:GNAT superfamily N-acetyltransferase
LDAQRDFPERRGLSEVKPCHSVRTVLREVTVTYLEMNSPGELVPGRAPPRPVGVERLGTHAVDSFRSTWLAIGAPYGWSSRPRWSQQEWAQRLALADVQVWIARVDEQIAGMIELELQAHDDVEIVVFGLMPAFVARGFGGHLLTVATRLAWDAQRGDGNANSRVWLHTSSRDHSHALANYLRRGFRVFRTDRRRHEVPEEP